MMKRQNHAAVMPPDESLRADMAQRINKLFERVHKLLDLCERIAEASQDSSPAALDASARILKATADLAGALLRVSLGETRHRSIIEKDQKELNSKIPQTPVYAPGESPREKLIAHVTKVLGPEYATEISEHDGE
jgi:hypothetical protein